MILFNWSPDGGLDVINHAGLELLGFTAEELFANRDLSRRAVHPDSKAVLTSALGELDGGTAMPRATELRLIAKDGHELWLEVRLIPVVSSDGSVVGLKGVGLEATALVEGRNESADGWEHYRRLFEEAPVAMWLVDPDHDVILEANAMACTLHGFAKGELDGVPVNHLVPPDDWPATFDRLREWQRSHKVEIIERAWHQRKDGTRFAVQVGGGPVRIGGRLRRLSFIEDLSKSEAAEGDVGALRAVADAATEGFLVIGPDGRIAFANAAAAVAMGRDAADLRGETPDAVFGPAAAGAGWPDALQAARTGEPFTGVVEVLRGDGTALAAQAEMRAAGRGGQGSFVVLTLRLSASGGRGSDEWEDWGAEIFLSLLQVHVEDLFAAARAEFSRSLERAAAGNTGPLLSLDAWQTLDKAGAFLKVFGDLSAARGSGGRWSPVERVRGVGELLAEAALRARPLFGSRDLNLKRKVSEAGAVSNAALARETLVCLIVECARVAAGQAAPLEIATVRATLHDKPAVQITIQGPPELALDRTRFALCRRASDAMDGELRLEPTTEAAEGRARVELTLPLV